MDYTRNWLKQNPENFPVASWLLPPPLRERICALYAFARGADEIADAPNTSAAERQRSLQQLDSMLEKGDIDALPAFAYGLGQFLPEYPALLPHARSLLLAFLQDTAQRSYRNYPELKAYSEHSAVPIGRMLVILCDEPNVDIGTMDAFCHAMQLLNHIRDCAQDYATHSRVYLPADWFEFAGATPAMLNKKTSTPQLRSVIHRGLDQVERLLIHAEPCLQTFGQRSLRTEITWMYTMAEHLSKQLRTHDPLIKKQRVSRYATMVCLLRAVCGM